MKTMLQIIDSSTNGGAEKHTKLIIKEFCNRGFKVFFIYPPGSYAEEYVKLKEKNVECIEVDFSKILKTILFIRSVIRKNKIVYIHSHQYKVDFLVAISRLGLKNTYHFSTIHNLLKEAQFSNAFFKIRLYLSAFFALQMADKVFTVSEYARKITLEYFLLKRNKVVTTLNSIDFEEMKVDMKRVDILRKKINIAKNATVISYMAALYPLKGHEFLIDAIGKFLKEENIILCLLGDGTEFEKIVSMVNYYGISDKVILPRFQKNIFEWYAISNIYVHPSLNECLPRAVLEAMYFGLPVIAADLPCIKEIIKNEFSGLIVEKRSAEAISTAIQYLMKNSNEAKQFGCNAQKFVRENCSMETMVDKVLLNIGKK